jgi:hypothetical protein
VIFDTGAPVVFDAIGGGLVSAAILALGGGAALAQLRLGQGGNPRTRVYEHLCDSLGGLALSCYFVIYFADGMGTLAQLIAFVPQFDDGQHTWTVWTVLGLWSLITFTSITGLCRNLGRPLGDRSSFPVIQSLCWLAIFGGLWIAGVHVPVPNPDDFLWQPAIVADFYLHGLYAFMIVENLAAIVLPFIGGGGGGLRSIQKQTAARNAPIIPAKGSST